MRELRGVGTRWLGVGLAACLAALTVALWATGRLGLYINPDSAWFAVGMSIVVLAGAALSFLLPLGAEAEHGHDHGDAAHADDAHGHGTQQAEGPRATAGAVAAVTGGVLASGVVVGALLLPPASLSVELAQSRDVGAPPLFSGSDTVVLAATGDTASFGVGDWASVFATATNTEAFEGEAVSLTGFVTPADGSGDFRLTRLVITHCVIDAQSASLAVASAAPAPVTGGWVTITGTVRTGTDGRLEIAADEVTPIDEPKDPYEY